MSEQPLATRDGFGQGLLEAAANNEQVIGLCADLTGSLRMREFEKKYPHRFIQVGVAEQSLIGTAAGLALGGKKPFAASYAAFSPGRTYDQIRVSIAYSNLNVVVVGGHAGLGAHYHGASHQMLEDVAMMTALPNMTVVQPCDAYQAKQATLALAELETPSYLRLSRPKVTTVSNQHQFELGKAQVLKPGQDLTIIASGIVVQEALQAAANLEQKQVSVRVVNIHTLKPLDEAAILAAASETSGIATVEDHQLSGGLGAAVCQVIAQESSRHLLSPVPVKTIGVKDTFTESGRWHELNEKYGLSSEKIVDAVVDFFSI